MQNRIVLISDDSDFYEYILPKLRLRKTDEVFRYGYDDVPEKMNLLALSLMIVNSENSESKVLDLLELVKGIPVVVFAYNYDEEKRLKYLKSGAYAYVTMFTSDEELETVLSNSLNLLGNMIKTERYREILTANNVITANNEVFLDCNKVLDNELEKINKNSQIAVLAAISPDEKNKFLLQPNQIETIILGNIRKNDILMNFAPNKYFLLLNDTNVEEAEKIWDKIREMIPEKIYAGFSPAENKKREQLVNDALSKLHEAITTSYIANSDDSSPRQIENFKIYRKEFNKKLEQIISPVFYHVEQKYGEKLFNAVINQKVGDGFGNLSIKNSKWEGTFRISSPGASKINIDISYTPIKNSIMSNSSFESKRIALEPEELERSVLEDLLEQFVVEFKSEVVNDTK